MDLNAGIMEMFLPLRSILGDSFPRLREREHLHLARHQETEELHRVPEPFHLGDDRNAVPAHKMLHPDLDVLPHGAGINPGEVGGGFIIQSHFIVLLQRVHDGRQQDGVIIRFRQAPFETNATMLSEKSVNGGPANPCGPSKS